MRSSARAPGGCWPRRCRPRWTPTSPSSPANATRMVTAWWSAMAPYQPREVLTSVGAVEVTVPRSCRGGRGNPEDQRGAAAAVSAWPAELGLRAGAGPVPRLLSRAVSGGHHPADRDLEGRTARVRRPGPVRRGLRLPMGGRHPRQHPPGGAQAVPAGDDRRARRRPQGTHRPGRRLPASPCARPRSSSQPNSATTSWPSSTTCCPASPRPRTARSAPAHHDRGPAPPHRNPRP